MIIIEELFDEKYVHLLVSFDFMQALSRIFSCNVKKFIMYLQGNIGSSFYGPHSHGLVSNISEIRSRLSKESRDHY